jgi:hypothetical protein
MARRVSWAVGLVVGLAASAAAADWPPLPAEVWSLRPHPEDAAKGAVVLEERLAFRGTHLEFVYRVRILDDTGKDAVEMPSFLDEAYGVEGRTVLRDGREVRFSDKKDLQKVQVKAQGESTARSRLVPPGVTGDCVVEMRWKESSTDAPGPLPESYGRFHQFRLGNRYRTLESTVEMPLQFPWAYLFTGPADLKPEVKNRLIYTYRDIPPIEDVPFMLEPARDLPRFVVFWQPDMLAAFAQEGETSYWDGVARVLYKEWYKAKTRGIEAFTREMLQGLPEDPQVKAVELKLRLDGRIVNTSALTFDERSRIPEKEDKKEIDSADLGATVRRGRTDGFGMFLLYLHLLREAGAKPSIALVADRDRIFFRRSLLTPFQLDRQLVVVSAPGRSPVFVDPALRFAAPGLVLPDYQGTRGLELDVEKWTVKPLAIPAQVAAFNVRQFKYEIAAGEEEDAFKVVAQFAGYPEFAERRRFMALEPKEQARTLKEDLEEDLRGATLTRAEVLGAQDPKQNVSWQAEGRREVEGGRRRILAAFPAMPTPLRIPSALAERRTLPIVMPYSRTHLARSRITLPAGYRLAPSEPLNRSNALGTVSYSAAETSPGVAEAALRVELNAVVLAPDAYKDLKDYLAWVDDASHRTVVLERAP